MFMEHAVSELIWGFQGLMIQGRSDRGLQSVIRAASRRNPVVGTQRALV